MDQTSVAPRPGQRVRAMVIAVVIATTAASGLLVGPRPQPANAGLVATGVNDRHTVKHDRVLTVPAPGVLANDLNLLGGTTAILVSGVSHGTLALRSDGGYTYTPAARYVGSDSFRYRPSGLVSTAATVTITVTNSAPVARPDAYSMAARTTLVVAAPGVLGDDSDADGDTLTVEMVGGGISGSLDLDPNGGFRYTPGGGASGTVTFSYRVWDGIVWSSSTTVSITITAPTPTPAPTPRPTPAPTASPTPTPRPTATPIVPLPSPSVGLPLPTLPLPTVPLPTAEASATPRPSSGGSTGPPPSDSPRPPAFPASPSESAAALPGQSDDGSGSSDGSATPTDSDAGATPGSTSASTPGSAAPGTAAPGGEATNPIFRGPAVAFRERRLELSGASVGLLAGIEIWVVPAATIAVPGLLLLLWVALQTAGALVWMPAVRRLERGGGPRRARPGARGT